MYSPTIYLVGANALFGERLVEIEPQILIVARAVHLQRVLDHVVEAENETEGGEALPERNGLVDQGLGGV